VAWPEMTENLAATGIIEYMIDAGDRVRVIDAFGKWHRAIAQSGVEGTKHGGRKVHDFPVIWVELDGYPGRMPWPRESVQPDHETAEDQDQPA